MKAHQALTVAALLVLCAAHAHVSDLPVLEVTADDTVIDRSCIVRIPPGHVIADAAGDGVIKIAAPNITLRFEEGSVLRGSPAGISPDTMTGRGIVVENQPGVRIENVSVEGFKVGLLATGADGLVVRDARFRDNFRQRLRSTPEAEDASDWLWPHANDNREWITSYGASLCVERSTGVEISRVTVREGQNGIVLDRVNASRIYDNDCSFLSGWGIAMWRSSDNIISRNALDFCVRGYSHGVYNRGQDSAGLLIFEQCSRNIIAENSITHGGDGIFGFGGKEALGETPAPEGFEHARKGCNDNLIVANDLSYAPAHGLEMTFSFGNRVIANQFVENAICGIWGGYSQETLIAQNVFVGNGDGGYGLERGAINIEHGAANTVRENTFRRNAVGVHLWTDDDGALLKTPWAVANHKGSSNNTIASNTFEADRLAIHLRQATATFASSNVFTGVEAESKVEGGEGLSDLGSPLPPLAPATYEALGESRPVGARATLAGRDRIVVGEWGPWDHALPLIRPRRISGGSHTYEVWGVQDEIGVVVTSEGVTASVEKQADGKPAIVTLSGGAGVHTYDATIRAGSFEHRVAGTLVGADWTVRFFPWTVDPRENLEGWRAESYGEASRSASVASLRLAYRHAGPKELRLTDELAAADFPRDRFGTIATTTLPLKAGRWRLSTLSDDGIRVIVDGTPLIENWTWHAPARDQAELVLDSDRPVEITVEHFELDGFAVLEFEIEPVPATPPVPANPAPAAAATPP